MTPLFPPPNFVFDPITMLIWGGIASSVPVMVFVFMAFTRRKLGMVISLVALAVTFSLGAVFIGPADATRIAEKQHYDAVAPWLDKYYPQYGGAALAEYVGTGRSFEATGPDGGQYTMYFDARGERGTLLVTSESKYKDGVPPVGDIHTFEELVKAQAEG